MMPSGPVLLAEDNPDDVPLVRLGFKKAGCQAPIHIVSDGEQAVQYLKGEGQYADRAKFPIPSILLLDLKLPRLNGFEVLSWIRQRPEWKCLPVVVLTTSHFGKDIEQAYDLGANSFLTKPTDLIEWLTAVKELIRFWLHDSQLPEPGPFVPAPKESISGRPVPPPGGGSSRSGRRRVRSKSSGARAKR